MKGNGPRISRGVVWSQVRPTATAIIITVLSCIIITPALTIPTRVGSTTPDPPPHKPCKSDFECPDNFYCYTRRYPLQYCAPCYPCSRLNREAADNNGCAKSRAECGPCLPGFHNLSMICIGVPDEFGRDNHHDSTTIRNEAVESTAGFPWWNLCIVGAIIIAIVVLVLMVTILILRKRPRWRRGPRLRRVEKDIELNEQNPHNSFLPSAPPPPYNIESQHHNQGLAHGATLVTESSQQRNPISLPPELLNSQDIIIVDDDDVFLNDIQDALLDALEQQLPPQPEEELEQDPDAVPNGDNFGDGWDDQDLSLHEESMQLEDSIDLDHQAAAVPPDDVPPLPVEENNSPFEVMLDIGFQLEINWAELVNNFEGEVSPQRSRNDSGVDDTSVNDDSMDHMVPNLDSHITENLDTRSAPHAGGRLETVYESPLRLTLEPLGYSSNDDGFSADETGDEGSPLNLNEVVGHDLDHENDDLMEVPLDLD